MAEHYTIKSFPDVLAYGSTVTTERKVDIIELDSGFEQRNSPWANSKHMYDVATSITNAATREEAHDSARILRDFWEERLGALQSFDFKDYTDYRASSYTIRESDGTNAPGFITRNASNAVSFYQLVKIYGDQNTSVTVSRPIQRPYQGVFASLGNVQTGVTTVNNEGDTVNDYGAWRGVIGINWDAIAETEIQIQKFEFYVPVRFREQTLSLELSSFEKGQFDSIPLIEVRLPFANVEALKRR